MKPSSNFKLPKSIKRLCLTRSQRKVFIKGILEGQVERESKKDREAKQKD